MLIAGWCLQIRDENISRRLFVNSVSKISLIKHFWANQDSDRGDNHMIFKIARSYMLTSAIGHENSEFRKTSLNNKNPCVVLHWMCLAILSKIPSLRDTQFGARKQFVFLFWFFLFTLFRLIVIFSRLMFLCPERLNA